MTRRAGALAAVLCLAAALVAVPAAPAQVGPAPPPERPPFLVGTHAFRRILYDVSRDRKSRLPGLTPLRGAGELRDPSRTIIIVLGKPDPLPLLQPQWPGGLRGFVQGGGALLVATDAQTPPVLASNFSVHVTGDILTLSAVNDDTAYRGMRECPYVRPMDTLGRKLFAPARPVASNGPSYLRLGRPGSRPDVLAFLPPECTDGKGNRGPWQFAAGGDLGSGRVLVMADHDVFINEMMLQNDNGNIEFAYRCAEWLRGDPAKPRDQVLYYEDGDVRTDFDIPLKNLQPLPLLPPGALVGVLDGLLRDVEEEGTLRQLEEEDFFNDIVHDQMAELPFWKRASAEVKLWTLAAIAASVALGLYAFVRLGAFRHRPDATLPALDALLTKQAPAGAVIEQRQQALLSDGNLWEAARELARHLFASAGASPDAGPAPPPLEVRGNWWRRWRARQQWRHLWRLARSARPVRVSPRDFARLAARVKALQAALADGTARIDPGG